MKAAVIMAGGYGNRFWPISRKSKPKQCLPINTNVPMIKDTYNRLSKLFKNEIYISTGKEMSNSIKKIMPKSKFIIEPIARNTAACIGLSAINLLKKDPEAVMFLETADHIYDDVEKYYENIEFGLDVASKENKIVLIGIEPSNPHTGYGYIEIGKVIHDELIKVHKVRSFKEKPTLGVAKKYVQSGKYLWNSGMFIAKCSVMLDEIKLHMPKLYRSLKRIEKSGFQVSVLNEEFKKMDKISIDNGVMEKSNNTYVLRGDMHWDDVGDLASFERFLKPDKFGNVYKGTEDYVYIDSKNNIVISDKKGLITTIGIEDSVIVKDGDAIFVAKKDRVQDVKNLLKQVHNKWIK